MWAGPAEDDFAARCAAPGVLICNGMDAMGPWPANPLTRVSTHAINGNIHPRGDGQYRDSIDSANKMSGAGSLKLQLDAGYADAVVTSEFWCCGGSLTPPPGRGLGQNFGPGSTFYVQYAVRFSPEMFTNLNTWNSQWKVSVIFGGLLCSNTELTWHESTDHFMEMYKNCGAEYVATGLDGHTWVSVSQILSGTPYLLQQGNFLCQYGVYANCWTPPSDTWITVLFKVHIASPAGAVGSTVEAWYSINRQAFVKWINVIDNFKIDSSNAFNNIYLSPYMTSLSRAASSTAYIWYDELIVSTQAISAPAAGSKPAAPVDLFLQ